MQKMVSRRFFLITAASLFAYDLAGALDDLPISKKREMSEHQNRAIFQCQNES